MRNRQLVRTAVYVLLLSGAAVGARSQEGKPFDAAAFNDSMRRYVREHPLIGDDAYLATRENCPPGFDCSALEAPSATPIRDSVPGAVAGSGGRIPTLRVSREQLGSCPTTVRCVEQESFWSPTNILLTSFMWSGAGYDTKTTMDAFALSGEYPVVRDGRPTTLRVTVYENGGPEQWFIERGTGALGGYKAAYNVPFAILSHKLRQSDNTFNRIVGYAVPVALGILQWKAGHDNQKEIDRINGLIR